MSRVTAENGKISLPRSGRPKRLRWSEKGRARRRAITSVVVVFIAWELIGRFVVDNPLFFVPISGIVEAAIKLAQSGQLWVDVGVSLSEFVVGLALAGVVGIALGALMSLSKRIRDYLEPWVSALDATPIIALGPLIILWFGLGMTSKVAVVFLMGLFAVVINTQAGLLNTDRNLIDAVRSFGANRWQLFAKVRLPSSLPFIVTGLRLAIARCLIGVVVAEFFGAQHGLGYLIFVSAQTFNTANLFVSLFILAGMGILFVQVLKTVEQRLARWRPQEEK